MDDRSYVGPQGLHRPNANPNNFLQCCYNNNIIGALDVYVLVTV